MSAPIVDRLTAAIRIADQCLHNTQFNADVINWTEARNAMLAARDMLTVFTSSGQQTAANPMQYLASQQSSVSAVKLDGRTREARAAKAAQ